MKEVLVLRDLECVKAVAHPKRIDILKAFDKDSLSAKQLSQLLDEPHAKINYHIKTLYKVGILELVEEKIKSGIVEKYYYPKARNIVIDQNILDFSIDEENKKFDISKFEYMSEIFYNAAEKEILSNENIIDYQGILLNNEEVQELNITIKEKIDDIMSKRKCFNTIKEYDIAFLTIPVSKEIVNVQ